MLLARETLYPLLAAFYSHLRDRFVVFLAVVVIAAVVWVCSRRTWQENQLYAIVLAGFSIFALASAIFRPGLSTVFQSYHAQPLAQYFYGMNLVSSLLIVLLCQDLTKNLSNWLRRWAPLFLFVLYAPGIVVGGGFGAPNELTTGPAPFAQDVVFAVATGRYANRDGTSSADGTAVVSPSPPFLERWCAVFVPRSWAIASVLRDRSVDLAKTINVPLMTLRASRGLAVTSSHQGKRIARLGFFRKDCSWIHETGDQVDPLRSEPGPLSVAHFDCKPGDIALLGDWTGSGETSVGIYRGGVWLLGVSDNLGKSGEPVATLSLGGLPGDIPVAGDWNGDGRTKIGIYRKGAWILDFNGNGKNDTADPKGGDRLYSFGGDRDIPLVGDWDGSGRDKIGVFRAGFLWVLDYNGNGKFDGDGVGNDIVFPLGGLPGDVPLVGKWDGDGRSKAGLYRNGHWLLDVNGNALLHEVQAGKDTTVFWRGGRGDVPVVWDQR